MEQRGADTAVVILNWNGARLLPACLSALAAQTYRDFQLLLVDNGSIDESTVLLSQLEGEAHPSWLAVPFLHRPTIIRNMANLGFAEGNNQAFRRTEARYIVTLNNDAIAENEWLAELLLTALAAPPQVGMVASTMLFSHRPGTVASAGISIHRDGVALDRGVGALSSDLEERGEVPVFGPSAGAALYRADLLRDTGLFDRRFFSYLEDADLAWRARMRGWRAVHNPRAKVLHEYSATGGHNSPFKTAHISRNRVWLLYKNIPATLARRHWPEIARYDTLAVARALLRGDRHLIGGRLSALRHVHAFALDRARNVTSARLHPDEVDAMLSPALSPSGHLRYRRRLDKLLAARF